MDYRIERMIAKTGKETVVVNGLFLHSKYDPETEAARVVEKEWKERFVHILFGYGLGYIAEKLLEKSPESDVIIIEPIEQFKINEQIFLPSQVDEINYLISSKLLKGREVKVICSPNYDKIAEEQYVALLKQIKDLQYMNIVNVNTINAATFEWQDNILKNIVYTLKDPSLIHYHKVYNCPFVLVASGPSLNKQLPKLKEIQNHVIIICAGTAINSLLQAGITPHYVVSIDGREINYKHFKAVNAETTLIYSLLSKYTIQQEYKADRIAFVGAHEAMYQEKLLSKLNIQLPSIIGGGSVANYAFTIAHYLTNGPIAMIGQDLAYTNNVSHSEGNKNIKEINEAFEKKRQVFEVEGYYGDQVKTDYGFFVMKQDFEKINRHLTHPAPVVNCTEGGVTIEGIEQMPFDLFITQYVSQQCDKIELQAIDLEKPYAALKELFSQHLRKTKELKRDVIQALYLVKQTQQSASFSPAISKQLQGVNNKIEKISDEILLERLTQPIMYNVMKYYRPAPNETAVEQYNRLYNQFLTLYKGIQEALVQNEKILVEAIELIEKERVVNNG